MAVNFTEMLDQRFTIEVTEPLEQSGGACLRAMLASSLLDHRVFADGAIPVAFESARVAAGQTLFLSGSFQLDSLFAFVDNQTTIADQILVRIAETRAVPNKSQLTVTRVRFFQPEIIQFLDVFEDPQEAVNVVLGKNRGKFKGNMPAKKMFSTIREYKEHVYESCKEEIRRVKSYFKIILEADDGECRRIAHFVDLKLRCWETV